MKILIYGTYKSGSTAVYEAIRQSGVQYGTYYEPEDLSEINFTRKHILCKYLNIQNFESDASIIESFDKVILLVRNPIDRLISWCILFPMSE